jgi:hypothetical protein
MTTMQVDQKKRSAKHICEFRDCERFAMVGHLMCPRHASAGGFRPESRVLSEKSWKLTA